MLRVIRNVLQKKPILAVYDVTKLCNERCPMCNIWKKKSNDMGVNRIVKMAKTLKDFGIGYVFIQGGEPTLRQDLIEIVDIFLAHKIKPTVITNGIRMHKALATEIAKRKCNLAISLDALSPEKYKRYRGVDAYDQVMNNIKEIAPMKRLGNWALTTTVSKLTTLEEVKALEALAKELGYMYAIRPYVYVGGTAGRKEEEMVYGYSDVGEIFEYMLEKAKKDNFFASLVYEEHIKYIQGEAMPICDAMRYSILMEEDGSFVPCMEFNQHKVDIQHFARGRRRYKHMLEECNCATPCFYNHDREIGIILRKKWRILLHLPQVIHQMVTYGNFF